MVSIPRKSHDTPFINSSKSISMTSDEYVVALEHKLERWEKVAQVEEKRMADLNITKNKKEKN